MNNKRVSILPVDIVNTHYRLHQRYGLTFYEEDLEKIILRKRKSLKKYVKPYIVLLLNFK